MGGRGGRAAWTASACAPGHCRRQPTAVTNPSTTSCLFEDGAVVMERLIRMGAFDCQDFDPVECDVERSAALHRDAADYGTEEVWRWALACETMEH